MVVGSQSGRHGPGPYPYTDWAVDSTTNRISDWRYDAAGNPIGISTSTLQWDGAGRLESIDSGSTASYSYDHLGRRIVKRAPSDNTQYFYDVTGKVLWEFDPDEAGDHQKMVRAYFNGRLFTSTGQAGKSEGGLARGVRRR